MFTEKVGKVTEEEKDKMLELHERKVALDELILSLSNPMLAEGSRDELYEKIVKDMGKTKGEMQTWWDEMYKKYRWKSAEGGRWNIDFKTREIVLVHN